MYKNLYKNFKLGAVSGYYLSN